MYDVILDFSLFFGGFYDSLIWFFVMLLIFRGLIGLDGFFEIKIYIYEKKIYILKSLCCVYST